MGRNLGLAEKQKTSRHEKYRETKKTPQFPRKSRGLWLATTKSLFVKLRPVLIHGCPAHTASHGNFNTGWLALERPQHKHTAFHQIETGPIKPVHCVIEQCRGVGEVSNPG